MTVENYSAENAAEGKGTGQNEQTNPNEGIASETQGREDNPSLYENDVFGKVIKRNDDSIWKRGKMRRIKHKEDE